MLTIYLFLFLSSFSTQGDELSTKFSEIHTNTCLDQNWKIIVLENKDDLVNCVYNSRVLLLSK